jgi:hypothetical protein
MGTQWMIGEKFLSWMDGVDVHVMSGNLQNFGKWIRPKRRVLIPAHVLQVE